MRVEYKRWRAIACPILAFCVGGFLLVSCSSGGQVAETAETPPPASSESANETAGATEPFTEPLTITGDTTGAATDTVHVADTAPEIVGGMSALYPFVNYPKEAKKERLEEKVVVQFVVTRDGEATGFRTLQGEHRILADVVINALQHVTFTPGLRNGVPTNVYMTVPVTFRLVDDNDD